MFTKKKLDHAIMFYFKILLDFNISLINCFYPMHVKLTKMITFQTNSDIIKNNKTS